MRFLVLTRARPGTCIGLIDPLSAFFKSVLRAEVCWDHLWFHRNNVLHHKNSNYQQSSTSILKRHDPNKQQAIYYEKGWSCKYYLQLIKNFLYMHFPSGFIKQNPLVKNKTTTKKKDFNSFYQKNNQTTKQPNHLADTNNNSQMLFWG